MSGPRPLPGAHPRPRPAPPRPEEGVVSWNLNTACNYRCSYCTQRFKEDRGRWARDTPRFLQAFARLPGRWEIKLSGGEPFVHPTLPEVVAGLAGLGHRVSVVTNLSASRQKLLDFVRAAGGRAGLFSASLHLEYVQDTDAFVETLRWLEQELRAAADPTLPRPEVCATSVATRAALPRLPEVAARFRAAGVRFKVQPEKQARDVIGYTPEEEAQILALGGHNHTGRIAHDFLGQPCWAGSRYFILDDEGTAFRCYPARRYKVERMGDFLDPAFELASGPETCLYRYCNCTVPIARGMMPREEGETWE
ncbi:MAG: radical SAM protein [Planctomycetota bacterium]